ncbi:MAG: hypothetical protein KGD74_10185, partial [Candidatus Lokiarchaeota archaeon]|nr:hypothetical protein [Candidatus Lokiarchaeota archaeon]
MSESRHSKLKIILGIFLIIVIIIVASIGIIIFPYDGGDGGDAVAYKPAIYLYPEETMKIKVSLSINGEITISEPEYNNGW